MESNIQTLQHCCFQTLHGELKWIDELDSSKPVVIFYFHPECEHCRYEASEIGKWPEKFCNVNMIMITSDTLSKEVEAFAIKYHLCEIENITILFDPEYTFERFFGTSIIPSIFIYGSDRKLIKKYNGEIKISAIINIIN